MSIFSTILDKLGLRKEEHAVPAQAPANVAHGAPAAGHTPIPAPAAPAHTSPAPAPAPVRAAGAAAPAHSATPMVSTEHVPASSGHTMSAPAPAAPAHTSAPSTPPLPVVSMEHVPTTSAPTAPVPTAEVHPQAISVVDVYAKLEAMAAARADKPNWKTSIADLLFLLGMDHSYQARKELAVELGCPQNLMDDSAKMNTWLHKTVLTKIAENGGNIPKELLD